MCVYILHCPPCVSISSIASMLYPLTKLGFILLALYCHLLIILGIPTPKSTHNMGITRTRCDSAAQDHTKALLFLLVS